MHEPGRQASQLLRHLDRFRIVGANITGIGPGRASMLASYGIETAADISRKRIAAIPGFNRMLTLELVRWRRDKEARFHFNPNEPVDRRDIQAMDAELAARRKELLAELREGPASLRSLAAQIRVARERRTASAPGTAIATSSCIDGPLRPRDGSVTAGAPSGGDGGEAPRDRAGCRAKLG